MATTGGALQFKAGPGAYAEIRHRGFSPERIGTIAGASGGPKWFVLSQLDRVLTERLLPAIPGPVHLIGSSIGAWRFACYAQQAPAAAIDRFEQAYLEQTYSENPDADEITATTRGILDTMLGPAGVAEILTHPRCRLHVMTALSRGITASERRPVLGAGLVLAAAANLVSRRALGAFFARALFYDARDLPPCYNADGLPLHRIATSPENLADAILASGAIPLVLRGVANISGAPTGLYRDGGVTDYHLDLPLSEPDRLTLFPHFFSRLIPGWFDKWLPYRHLGAAALERTVVICPSPHFIEKLPHRKIPDRHDFVRFTSAERLRNWRETVRACRELADELNDVIERDQLAARLEPL